MKGRKELSVLSIFVKLFENLKNKRLKTTLKLITLLFFFRLDLKNSRKELSIGNDMIKIQKEYASDSLQNGKTEIIF